MKNSNKEAKKREIVRLIQSRCVHRRRVIIGWAKLRHQRQIVNKYRCLDCEKTLYDREKRGDENGS